jgi:hypothetical protein
MKMVIFRAEVGIKVKNKFYFYSKSPLLDVGGFANQGIKKYSPKWHEIKGPAILTLVVYWRRRVHCRSHTLALA